MSYVPSSLGRSAIKPSTDEINRQKQLKAWLASDLNHEDEVQYDHLDVSGPTKFPPENYSGLHKSLQAASRYASAHSIGHVDARQGL